MPGIRVGLKVEDAEVRELFERAPGAVLTRLRQLIEGAAIDIQGEMRKAAPVAVTGNLRNSIRYTFAAVRLQARIYPAAKYGEYVEEGRGPRLVSVAEGTPLREWAELKGINPYALRNSIAKKGTKAHPFVEPTYRKMEPIVTRDITKGLIRLVEDLTNGRV